MHHASPLSPLPILLAEHLDLVYAAALRQTHNPHLAEDITQTVFLLAARKHKSIPSTHAAAWLIKVTRYVALTTLRANRRRRLHEQRAATEAPAMTTPSPTSSLDHHLDAALAALSQSDRELLLRRYFQNHPVSHIAASLHLTPNTTTKRLDRALQKLRRHLARHGLTDATLSILPTTLLATSLQKAPHTLAPKILVASTLAPITSIPFALLLTLASTQFKLLLAALLLALLLTTTYALFQARPPLPQPATFVAATAPVAAPAVSGNFVKFPPGNATTPAQAELLAVSTDRRAWWSPDGAPFPHPLAGADFPALHDPYNEHRILCQFVIRLADLPAGAGPVYFNAYGNPRPLYDVPLQPDPHDPSLFYAAGLLYPEQKITHVLLHFSTQPWEKIVLDPARKLLTPPTRLSTQLFRMLSIVPSSMEDINGHAVIRLGLEPFGDYEYKTTAIAADGSLHAAADTFVGPFTNYTPVWSFDIPLHDIQRFEITIRLLDRWISFEDISLVLNQHTDPYSTTHSVAKSRDSRFYNLQFEIGHQVQLNDLPAAAVAADTLLTQATQRRANLLDNPDLYLIDKGLPLLTQLRDALRAGDLPKANALMDTSTGTGFRLQRALQAIAEN